MPVTRSSTSEQAAERPPSSRTRRWLLSWTTWFVSGWRPGLVGFALLVLALDLLARSGLVHPYYFPPAGQVLAGTFELLGSPRFLTHVGSTVYVSIMGLGLICVVGIPLGMLLGASNRAYQMTYALIEFFRPIPAVALIPVAILALGTGNAMKVSLIVIGAIWPVLFNTVYGMHNVDPVAKETALSFGCTRLDVLGRVSLPSALPLIYTGIRIAAAVSLILAISAEMLSGAERGIGAWLLLAGQAGSPPYLVYGGTVLAGVLGWGANTLLVTLRRRMLPWAQG